MVLSPQFADPSRVTAAGIVAYILEAFHIKPRRSLVLAQKQLEDRLAAIETPVALCFDECHRLSDTTLTALKNFYELGTGGFRRYLGLILFGQPQFRERLKMPRFREIAERLDIRDLPAFSAEEVEAYLTHCFERVDSNPGSPPYRERGHLARMDAQRSQSSPPNSTNSTNSMNFSFPPETIAAIAARASTPLAIANLAAAAMTAAYKKGERTVLARFVPAEPGPKTLKLAK